MLTRKQLELLTFIRQQMEENGVPPSFDEMREALGLRSKSGIHRLITALEEREFVRRLPHRARALEIIRLPGSDFDKLPRDATSTSPSLSTIEGDRRPLPPGAMTIDSVSARELPVMGRIAAGVPIEAISEVSHHVAVPETMLSGRNRHYALEVKGDSMIDAGINDGDVVVIREQATAENGDIVVALIDGHEATLKRFHRRGRAIALEAANPAYEARVLPDHLVKVQGRLVGLIRNY